MQRHDQSVPSTRLWRSQRAVTRMFALVTRFSNRSRAGFDLTWAVNGVLVMCRNTNHPGKRLPSADDRSSKVSYKRPSEVTGAIRLQSTRDSLASQGARRAVEQARIADNIYAAR